MLWIYGFSLLFLLADVYYDQNEQTYKCMYATDPEASVPFRSNIFGNMMFVHGDPPTLSQKINNSVSQDTPISRSENPSGSCFHQSSRSV
jgi:hypothetical protein